MIFAQDADLLTYPTCSTHGWSILNSASTNAGIAGVLAGFAFTAGVVYVGRQERPFDEGTDDAAAIARHIKARSIQDVQTVSLFVVSFITLGLDSFIWSVVAGSRPVVGLSEVMVEQPPDLCSRVWSQAIIAVGMFGLGAIAMVCNITSLFLWQQSTVRDEDSRNYLKFFLLVVTAGAVLGVVCFVGSDAMNYLDVLYAGHPPMWFTTTTAVVTFGGLAIALGVGASAYFGRLRARHVERPDETAVFSHCVLRACRCGRGDGGGPLPGLAARTGHVACAHLLDDRTRLSRHRGHPRGTGHSGGRVSSTAAADDRTLNSAPKVADPHRHIAQLLADAAEAFGALGDDVVEDGPPGVDQFEDRGAPIIGRDTASDEAGFGEPVTETAGAGACGLSRGITNSAGDAPRLVRISDTVTN